MITTDIINLNDCFKTDGGSAVTAMSNYGMNSRSVISTKDMFSGESGGSGHTASYLL